MKKIALFFGAGAELSYGLPSGGKFALDIFRMNTDKDKKEFKTQIKNINNTTKYASWFPLDVENKKLSAFTKRDYEMLVKGSLENKRNILLAYFKNFDKNVSEIAKKLENDDINIENIFEEILGIVIGDVSYKQKIKLNSLLSSEYNCIFDSAYFSAFLSAIELEDLNLELKKTIREATRSILELLIGSLGENLINNLNDGIFEKSPDSIDLFDDLGSVFTLDYKNIGMKGLELLLDSDSIEIKEEDTNETIIKKFVMLILEDIYSRALDYQSLIDLNWRYIYNPKTDWGKFSKINIFLHTVRRYISNIAESNREKINTGNGYYHDICNLKNKYTIGCIATTNYNTFIKEVTNEDVFFLNGSVEDYYDPYLNKIIKKEENKFNHVVVPFLFTQSGTKPLTSVKMSSRYVEVYNKFRESDIICVCGFGFNLDDGHINGMFRELADDDDKRIVILHFVRDDGYNKNEIKRDYKDKLRLNKDKNIEIIIVDKERKDVENSKMWYESIGELF